MCKFFIFTFATVLNSRINSWETWFIFNLRKININQHCNSIMICTNNIFQKLKAFLSYETILLQFCTYLNGLLLGAPRKCVLHGLDPGLNWATCRFCFLSVFLVCSGPPGILLFVPTDQVSHLTPSLLTGWLLTNVQLNNMATLHGTFTTYIYTSHCHYYPSSSLYFFHSSWQAGRLYLIHFNLGT